MSGDGAALHGRLAALTSGLAAAVARRPGIQDEVVALLGLLEEEYAAVGGLDVIDEVVHSFGLTPLDGDLLVVAAAAELDVRFGAVFGLVQGSERWQPNVGLALEVCGCGSLSRTARGRLREDAPLRRHLLVTVEGPGPALLQTLSVPERVVAHLLGDTAADRDVAVMTLEVPPRYDDVADLLARALRTGARLGHVRARAGTTGLSSARGALDLLGLPALVVDLSRRPGHDVTQLARLALREAGLTGAGLVLTGVDQATSADAALLGTLDEAPTPIVVVDDIGWEREWCRGPLITVEATALTPQERGAMWAEAVGPVAEPPSAQWRNLVGLRMTPEHIAAAIEAATISAGADDVPVSLDRLHQAARDQGRVRLEGAGVRTVPQATLADLVLPTSTRRALEHLISWTRHREALLGAGRLAGRATKGHGLTALFTGVAGTGKTLAAEAVAGELGLELCTVDLSLVVDKYVGETEKHLERLINEAENLNVVLLFDEADSLFGSRSAVSDARDRYANQEVSYLLQRIERFEGLAILATNLRGNIDPAFTRRLQHVINFADPDAPTRRGLWEAHLGEVMRFDPVDPPDLDWLAAAVELPGGGIRNIVMAAAFAAAAEHETQPEAGAPVGMRHLHDAVQREYQKQARRVPHRP